jgi:tetratricopeptide (TPR) repeat protein
MTVNPSRRKTTIRDLFPWTVGNQCRARKAWFVCVLLIVTAPLILPMPFPSSAMAGAIGQLEGITGQKIDRYQGGGGGTGGGGEGEREYRDPFTAPIFAMPAGFVGGLFMGGHWYVKKMIGDYPKTLFLTDYMEHQKIKDDTTAFSAGAFIGGIPWLALYTVTGPIRYAVASIGKAVSAPSAPKPKNKSEMAREYYDSGKMYESAGNWSAAAAKYEMAMKGDPTLEGGYSKWAHALFRQGKYAEAIKTYEQSMAVGGQDPGTCKNIADIFGHNLGNNKEAEQWYRKALDLYPAGDSNRSVVARELIATVDETRKNAVGKSLEEQKSLLGNGKYELVVKKSGDMLALYPDSTESWSNRAVAYEKQGLQLQAAAALRKLGEIDPRKVNIEKLKDIEESEGYKSALSQLKSVAQNSGFAAKAPTDEGGRYFLDCFDNKLEGCTYKDKLEMPVVPEPTRSTVRHLIDDAPAELKKDPRFMELAEQRKKIEGDRKIIVNDIAQLTEIKNRAGQSSSGPIDVLIVKKQIELDRNNKKDQFNEFEIKEIYTSRAFTPDDSSQQEPQENPSPPTGI